MPTTRFVSRLTQLAVACVLVAVASPGASAQTYTVNLIAAPTTTQVNVPNRAPVVVPMWGFALDVNGNGVLDGVEAATVPGPRIVVPPTATTLEIRLTNRLVAADGGEPVSVVIPGQAFNPTVVRNGDGRVMAMTPQAAPNGGTATYTFPNVRAGTFLYQSGSHQAVQIQMGLYGAMTRDVAAGTAYVGISYVNEVVLLYSEIDVALHEAVTPGADGQVTFGNSALGGPTSTIDYAPTLYLVNGRSYADDLTTPPMTGGVAGQATLIRLLNAGLKSHAPTLDNGALSVVAEDGNRYPFGRPQAALLLAAGKTHDAIWMPTAQGVYSVYDRLLNLNANGQGMAGMLAKLRVAAAGAPAPGTVAAVGDAFLTATEDLPFASPVSVLANDTGATAAVLATPPYAGSLVLAPNGTFVYTPAPNFFGVDSFTYAATNGIDTSVPAQVLISVAGVPDAPVATGQGVGVGAGESVPITLQGGDPDGDVLSFYVSSLPPTGSLSFINPVTSVAQVLTAADLYASASRIAIPNGMLIYTAGAAPGTPSFGFRVVDATSLVSPLPPAVVNITVRPSETSAPCLGCVPVTLTVQGTDGANVTAYRWTVEEDRMHRVTPGVLDPNMQAVSFHRSYMPVVQSGVAPAQPSLDFTDGRRYFVSVLPEDGTYGNGGAAIAGGGGVNVTVPVGPIPTAQVRVRVFRDDAPLNGDWDSVETGLAGFAVTLEDAGGRYGVSAAQQLMDAFGNPLGTVYTPCPTPPCESYEVLRRGNGFVLSDAEGYALFENVVPGKYGVNVLPPAGQPWQQTSTIEGKKAIDAWVKANEPTYFAEFGPPGPHAFVGFIQATDRLGAAGATVTGQVTNLRLTRPPDPSLYSGAPFDFTRPWVALNTGIGTGGTLEYVQPTDEEGNFSITGVPAGPHTLVVFDSALNVIIAQRVLNVAGAGTMALGPVPVLQWFTRVYNYVFEDANQDGFRDDAEPGMAEQAINIRFRDGSLYQSAPTDGSGFVPFEEVFPFFSWLVAEVDFTRFRATGVTTVVDNGGNATNAAWPAAVGAEVDARVLLPQPQSENGNAPFRTETGPVLVEAFQGFIGQSSVLLWGKAPYAGRDEVTTDVDVFPFGDFPGPGDADNGNGVFDADQFNGGVSGIVHYSTTRAENDPRWGGAEPWEPGIPGVRVQLWDVTRTRLLNEATTDSWDESLPTGCQGPIFTFMGNPTDCYDGLRNFNQVRPGVFDGGYAFFTQIEPTTNTPANWLTPVGARGAGYREVPLPAGNYVVRVIVPPGYQIVGEEDKNVDFGLEFIPQQFYLGGYPLGDGGPSDPAAAPRVENTPLAVPFCVGTLREVPAELALFPGVPGTYAGQMRPSCDSKLVTLRDGQNPGVNFFLFTEAPVAAHIVGFVLDDLGNEFDPNSPQFGEKYAPPFLPVAIRDFAGREIARTYTDAYGRYNVLVPSTFTANVPAPSGMSPSMLTACVNAPTLANGAPDPQFNRKYSHFCYTLQYMPGTTTYADTPVLPTGAFAGADQFPVDVEFPNQTPVIASVNNPLGGGATGGLNIGPYIVDRGRASTPSAATRDAAHTIVIQSVGDVQVVNPYYEGLTGGAQPKLITRDYGFGAGVTIVGGANPGPNRPNGVVRLNGVEIPQANILSWTNTQITVRVPTAWTNGVIPALDNPSGDLRWRTGQLGVERCLARTANTQGAPGCTNWRESVVGVTLTVASEAMHAARPPVVQGLGESVQAAINRAAPGSLVLVRPGTHEEMVVMTRPVRLQGWGAAVTRINVVQSPSENLQAWRNLVSNLLTGPNGTSFLLPDQVNILGAPPLDEEAIAAALGGEGAGVTVLGRNFPVSNLNGYCGPPLTQLPVSLTGALLAAARLLLDFGLSTDERYCLQNENHVPLGQRLFGSYTEVWRPNARIDGLSINGSSNDAGVAVNGNARFVEMSNNRIFNNLSWSAGGIRVGHPGATLDLADEDANNRNVAIHNNQVTENSGLMQEGGGGIVIGTGAPNYVVQNNWVAGNFTGGQGAGISHRGLSPGGIINRNTVIFNESFNQGQTVSGGGISIGGRTPVVGALTPGAGSVRVSNNLIQGNQAASGDGGGISLAFINGQDLTNATPDYQVDLFNNVIVNNEAGLAGGGISLQDAVSVRIINNTVAHNDSLATAGAAFFSPTTSTPQPAGIVSRGHSPALAALTAVDFSSPQLVNSIVWENRSFFWGQLPGGVQIPGQPPAARFGLINTPALPGTTACTEPVTATWRCWDLGVLGAPAGSLLNPQYSVLTSTSAYPGGGNNVQTAPSFAAQYVNGSRNTTIVLPEPTTISTPAAFDEGGNFVRPIFGPLTLTTAAGLFYGNHHVTAPGANGQALNALFGSVANIPGTLLFDFDLDPRPTTPAGGGVHRGADQAVAPTPTTPVPTRR